MNAYGCSNPRPFLLVDLGMLFLMPPAPPGMTLVLYGLGTDRISFRSLHAEPISTLLLHESSVHPPPLNLNANGDDLGVVLRGPFGVPINALSPFNVYTAAVR